jgi:two-component system, NtrC family, response regulator HydG
MPPLSFPSSDPSEERRPVTGPSGTAPPVLLVDDETHILFVSRILLRGEGLENVHTLDDSREVLPFLKEHEVGVIVLDLYMPHITGTELLGEITYHHPHIPVIVMTGVNNIDTAVECMKRGAFDYLVKPVEKDRFVFSIKRAYEMSSLHREVSSLKQYLLTDQLRHGDAFSSIVTGSKKMRSVFQYVEAIAGTEQPVLITGETGVGKELIARSVHALSGRRGAFVPVNLAGLDDNMFSDTLFGHKKGAYTGADRPREGLVNQALDGTLFLDEIGDINDVSQVRLLRLLQEHEYYPLGSDIVKKSNARIVVATNQDLQKKIGEGRFRNDLYYRLRTHQVFIPPLRERSEDIPPLLDHFLRKAAKALGKRIPSYPPELVTLLSSYPFPGNARELETMVFDALARHRSGVLSLSAFRSRIEEYQGTPANNAPPETALKSLGFAVRGRFPTLRETEDYLISQALAMADNNQGIAASLLGITRQALNKRLNRKKQ